MKNAIRGGRREEEREATLAWRNSNGVEDGGESENEGESEGKIKALGWRAGSLRSEAHMARLSRSSV